MRTWVISLVLLAAACGPPKKQPKVYEDAPGTGSGSDSGMPMACAGTVTNGMKMSVKKIGTVQGSAILATSPPNDDRLFVIEQGGRIRIFDAQRTLVATPFIDLSSKLTSGGELGLLGLAFHPKYAQNGYFYVWYTANNPAGPDPYLDILERYKVSSDPNVGDATSGQILLSISDFASNHNGGMLEFGADNFLYVGTGDGGQGGDPHVNGQNKNALLAKILRIDVDNPSGGNNYGIPSDNPFAGGGGAPEVFIYGVRNPWRWSFDRGTGDLWIGDVGQNAVEELDVLPAGQANGKNLGWNVFEGNTCYNGNAACATLQAFTPQYTYTHTAPFNCIIGGQVYRGACYPDIVGYYFFSDNGAGNLARAHLDAGAVTVTQLPAPSGGWPASPSSIHADSRGELYETTTNGSVYHLEAGP